MCVYISLNLLVTVNCVNAVTMGDLDVKKNKNFFKNKISFGVTYVFFFRIV